LTNGSNQKRVTIMSAAGDANFRNYNIHLPVQKRRVGYTYYALLICKSARPNRRAGKVV